MQGFSRQIVLVVLIACFVCIVGLVYICLHQKRGMGLQAFFQELKKQKPVLLEKPPSIQIKKIAAYLEARDPFKYEELSSARDKQSSYGLQSFPLSELKLVGIILQGDKFWAIIKTPDKRIYRATIGMRIGQNNGYITKITKQRVDILERKDVVEGDWINQPASLHLMGTKDDQQD